MKKMILIALAVSHIFLSLVIFIVGSKYEFTVIFLNSWLMNLTVSVLFLGVFILGKEKVFEKIVKPLLVIYPLGLFFIISIVFYNLPNYTYAKAREIVLNETSEEIDDSKENEIKGQLGMYYIYTKENVYIFNSKDGKYAKRIDLKK